MPIAPLLMASIALQDPQTVVFRDTQLNIQFNRATDWKQTKSDKRQTNFDIPIPGGTAVARLEIVRAQFRGDRDTWQSIQARANEQAGRTVVRQYEQELLGAPVLLTQVEFNEKGLPMMRLSGLHYTRTAQKFLFNLTAPVSSFDSVSFLWNQTLESFRTVNGQALLSEDPNSTLPAAPVKIEPVRPPRVISNPTTSEFDSRNYRKAEATVADQKVGILVPKDWTIATNGDGTLTLTRRGLDSPVQVKVDGMIDADAGRRALSTAANDSLKRFTVVAIRQDVDPTLSATGNTVGSVWRNGTAGEGELATFEGFVAGTSHFMLVRFETAKPNSNKNAMRWLRELLESIDFAPTP